MFTPKWICCLEQNENFVAMQADILDSLSIYYEEYYGSLTGIEVCKKCKATYAVYMVVEFTTPKIYFHIPISNESYESFALMEVIKKTTLLSHKLGNKILVEREINNKSIWEWQVVNDDFLDSI